MYWKGTEWNNLSETLGKTSKWSLLSAVIVTIVNFYVVVLLWAHDKHEPYKIGGIPWFIVPTVAVGIVTLAGLYWLGLVQYHRREKPGRTFRVNREPRIKKVDFRWIQVSERVTLEWKGDTEDQNLEMRPINGPMQRDLPAADILHENSHAHANGHAHD